MLWPGSLFSRLTCIIAINQRALEKSLCRPAISRLIMGLSEDPYCRPMAQNGLSGRNETAGRNRQAWQIPYRCQAGQFGVRSKETYIIIYISYRYRRNLIWNVATAGAWLYCFGAIVRHACIQAHSSNIKKWRPRKMPSTRGHQRNTACCQEGRCQDHGQTLEKSTTAQSAKPELQQIPAM